MKDWTQGVAFRTIEGIVCAGCFCTGGANLDEIDSEDDILTADDFGEQDLDEDGDICVNCENPVDLSVCAEHVLYGVPKEDTTAHHAASKR